MKIIYATPGCFDKGGISRYTRYQIRALREIFGKNEVFALSLLGPDDESFEDDFQVDYYGSAINGRWEQIKFAFKLLLTSLIKRPEFLLVAHVNFSGLGYIISRLSGSKCILNVYGLELWSSMRKDAAFGLRKVDALISDCYNTKDYLLNSKLRSYDDITVIWDCVDLNKFKPFKGDFSALQARYNLADNGKIKILTLGRLAQEAIHKGYHRLLEVFEQLDQSKYYLIIAGKGNMKEELESIVKEKGLMDNVCFTGMVLEEDMNVLYSYADIFSLVSEVGEGKGEGIPLTPLEAMACGTPIIVGNQDGSRESIFDNRNGSVVDPMDLTQHLEAIQKWALFKVKGSEANTCEEVAKSNFSYSRFLAEHHQFFTSIQCD